MLSARRVTKTYRKQGRVIRAVQNLDFELHPGDFAVIHGPSGSGKSTLLLLLGGMLRPDEGRVQYESDDIYALSPRLRNRFRKRAVGFVFQRYFLVPYLNVFDNIRLSLSIQGTGSAARDEIMRLARQLRIEQRMGHRPGELSAGEQQRAAVARALAGNKPLILADEPTGNLDAPNARIIADCLTAESKRGRTVLLVTHDRSLLGAGTREFELVEGTLIEHKPVNRA